MPNNSSQQLLIPVQDDNIGGSGTITGNLTFGDGSVDLGCDPVEFGSIAGDNPIDNKSNSTILVNSIPAPVTLTVFDARLINCQPALHWVTETEINSECFEIERGRLNNSNWATIGTVTSHGNSTQWFEYNFQTET